MGSVQTSPLHGRSRRSEKLSALHRSWEREPGQLKLGKGAYVWADIRLRYAMLTPSIMSISPPSGQFGPYIQTAFQT